MSLRRSLLTALVIAVVCGRCSANPEPPDVVFLVGGIGGLSPLVPSAHVALPLAGINHELRDFSWQHGKGRFIRDLQDAPHLKDKAAELAKEIRELRQREPNRRIYLVGHSAGTAIVLYAAEMLPPESVERIILLSSALSPYYDLTAALRATRGEIVSFYSPFDFMLLDWGTSQFGTADRVYGRAAGLHGFVTARASRRGRATRSYERLLQVPWTIDRALELAGRLASQHGDAVFLGRQRGPVAEE